jgi:CelD/BcsL family acetyltransferase involved in cellulose biosynthesis
MPRYETKLITDPSAFDQLMPDWESLWNRDPRATIFAGVPWARASWRAYGSRRSLCISVVRRDSQVVGILPLATDGDTLRFLGDPRSDYNDMICAPDAGHETLESALDILCKSNLPWRRCILANVPERSNIVTQFPHITRPKGMLLHLTHEATCPFVDLTSDAEHILADILKKKSLKRHENKLGRLGHLEFRHLTNREEIKDHLPHFFQQHIAHRAMEGDKSLFCDSVARAFYEYLVGELDPYRELRFSVVEIDGKPVAYHFGFEDRNSLIWYKPSFDEDYWDYSPGEVLIKKLFEYVRDRRLSKFDFTVGDEVFKTRFANRIANNYAIHAFRRSPIGSLGSVTLCVKDGLKKHPKTYRAAKHILSLAKNSVRNVHSTLKRNGVSTLARKLWLKAWRGAVFSRDEVLVFSIRGDGPEPATEGIEIKEGTLRDLACLAATHGEFITPGKLATARHRRRRGDRLHLAWKNGELAHVAWMGNRADITASFEIGNRCRVDLERPSPVIFDCWTPPTMRGQGIYPLVLRQLVNRYRSTTTEYWIYCLRDNIASIRGIEKSGFLPRYRMRRTRLFHYIEWNRVSVETII